MLLEPLLGLLKGYRVTICREEHLFENIGEYFFGALFILSLLIHLYSIIQTNNYSNIPNTHTNNLICF